MWANFGEEKLLLCCDELMVGGPSCFCAIGRRQANADNKVVGETEPYVRTGGFVALRGEGGFASDNTTAAAAASVAMVWLLCGDFVDGLVVLELRVTG